MKKEFKPFNQDQIKALSALIFWEKENSNHQDNDIPFLSQIIQKRIDVLKLPISFTFQALLSVNCFCESPGQAIVFLIELLNTYENQKINLHKICELFPEGFYTQKYFEFYIDNELQNKKFKEIY